MVQSTESTPQFNVFITEPKDHPSLDILRSVADVRLGRKGARYSEDELAELVRDCDALMITSRDRVTRKVIESAPRLRVISKYGARPENVDLEAAEQRGIRVLSTPLSNTESVAEHTILLMLSVLRQLCTISAHLRAGGWRDRIPLGVELAGKTVGLIGLGNVGGKVAEKLAGFGVKLLAHDPYADEERAVRLGVALTDVDTILAESDVVSLHAMVTAQSRHMIGESQLRRMRESAILINTARGSLIDESALVLALQERWIAGAGLDVFEDEPATPQNPLLNMENVIATPHAAAYTREAIDRELPWAAEDVKRVLMGEEPMHS